MAENLTVENPAAFLAPAAWCAAGDRVRGARDDVTEPQAAGDSTPRSDATEWSGVPIHHVTSAVPISTHEPDSHAANVAA